MNINCDVLHKKVLPNHTNVLIYKKVVFWLFKAQFKSAPKLPIFGAGKQLISSETVPVVTKIFAKFSLLRPPPNSSHLFLEEPLEQALTYQTWLSQLNLI